MSSDSAALVAGTTRLFVERSAPGRLEIAHDEHGFLRPSPLFFTFERLLERPCSLVVAPPWIGKSFTARRISSFLRTSLSQESWHHFTDLEARLAGEPLLPGWWNAWQASDDQATWIIDALDEGQRREAGFCLALVRHLESLSGSERKRLRLILFARESDLRDIAKTFEQDLLNAFREGYSYAELLPLDLVNARDLVLANGFSEAQWEQVLRTIERNDLRAVAAYPAALLFLARHTRVGDLSERYVWAGVLKELLEEHAGSRAHRFESELDSRFAAAERLAAVMTLAGEDELASSSDSDHLTLVDIFPFPEPTYLRGGRGPARECLRSGMFRSTANGHRFLHKNVRDWMAAFGLSRLPLPSLRPALQAEAAPPAVSASIRPEFSDLAQLLVKLHEIPEVRDWIRQSLAPIPSDLFPRDLGQVRAVLDRLEQLAARGGRASWIDNPVSINHLAVSGLENELAARLRDTGKTADARKEILKLGTALGMEQVLAAAAEIILDTSDDEGLRSWCASALSRPGPISLLGSLESFVDRARPVTRIEKQIVSSLLSGFVESGLWTVARAFRSIPRGAASDLIDSTRVLPHTLADHMTFEDADEIVTSLNADEITSLNSAADECARQKELRSIPRWEVYAIAVSKIATTAASDPGRIRFLIPFTVTLGDHAAHRQSDLATDLRAAFRNSRKARRALFEATVRARQEDSVTRSQASRWIFGLLLPEDLAWLEAGLPALAEGERGVWSVALRLSRATDDQPTRKRVELLVDDYCPGLVAGYEEDVARQAEWEHEDREKKTSERAKQVEIERINRELLSALELSDKERLSRLSWVNFSDDAFRPKNLVGSWSDLDPVMQDQVLDKCAAALDSVQPTQVPEGASYPISLQWEAQAFVALLDLKEATFRLTRSRIERWLPAVLKAFHRKKNEVLNKCLEVSSERTEKVLLDAIGAEIRDKNAYSVLLQDLPPSLWTEKVTHWVAEGIRGDQPREARASLLELLAARKPEAGIPIARAVLADLSWQSILALSPENLGIGEPDNLAIVALNVLLALAPEEAIAHVEEGFAKAGERLLVRLRSLTSATHLQARWWDWPPDRIVRLSRLLFEAYPPHEDPPVTSGIVRLEDELRNLRWRLLDQLLKSNGSSVERAIDEAKKLDPTARQWIEGAQASAEADSLLARSISLSETGISIPKAVRLLDEEYFRLIRTADDLLEVVVEELANLERDVDSDFALLYLPTAVGATDTHLPEEALQAYILRRLADRLPGKVLDRETLVKRKRRTDIRILAPVLDRRERPAEVVIEVKWSDNSSARHGVSTGLTGQLGKNYLLKEGLTSGVYLVGWTGRLGTWKRTAGPRPSPASAATLAEALHRQAEEFRRNHPTIDVRPIVWDLARDEGTKSVKAPRSATRARISHAAVSGAQAPQAKRSRPQRHRRVH
jgi:hypothetical protein